MITCPLANPDWAEQTALVSADGESVSYADLSERAEGTVARLRQLGVVPGQVVSLCEPNSVELIAVLVALWRTGATAQILSTRLPDAARDSLGQQADRQITAADLTGKSIPAADTPVIDLHQIATLIYTSGSSGLPKAAVHDYGNHYYNALGANENMPVASGDRWLLSLPLYHVGGLAILFRCFISGATVVLPDQSTPLSGSIGAFGITHLSVVPTQLRRLLNNPPCQWPKAILVGGAPLPTDLCEQVIDQHLPVHTTYGLTECASQVTTGTNPNDSGSVLAHRELAIADDGEILVRGRVLFRGYLASSGIDPARDEDGWFHTGDLGELRQGSLTVLGRKDNMFISGGENIQPEEIEDVLLGIPGVEEAIVVPVADVEFGHRPVAFLSGDWDEKKVRQILADKLPGFKIPVRFHGFPAGIDGGIKRSRIKLRDWLAVN